MKFEAASVDFIPEDLKAASKFFRRLKEQTEGEIPDSEETKKYLGLAEGALAVLTSTKEGGQILGYLGVPENRYWSLTAKMNTGYNLDGRKEFGRYDYQMGEEVCDILALFIKRTGGNFTFMPEGAYTRRI